MAGQLPKTCSCEGANDVDLAPPYNTFANHFAVNGDEFIAGRVKTPAQRDSWNLAKDLRSAGVGTHPWTRRDEYSVEGALDHIQYHFTDPRYDRCTPDTPLLLKVSLALPHLRTSALSVQVQRRADELLPQQGGTPRSIGLSVR